ncbi:hypothetical protein Syun_013076 [Stephania yunnanensis]|uniref:Uncharacterized protein n=1 Tax=Stephania yunnanensis TaxID=152371 RepID=A0AAP0K0P9_9MAGN
MKYQVCPLEFALCDSTGLGPIVTDIGRRWESGRGDCCDEAEAEADRRGGRGGGGKGEERITVMEKRGSRGDGEERRGGDENQRGRERVPSLFSHMAPLIFYHVSFSSPRGLENLVKLPPRK